MSCPSPIPSPIPIRTRFAPSPTGYLHVGGLRTALFSYLMAKKSGGKFLLRIEDTDQERSIPGAVENILRTLHWASLDPDEGVILREGAVTQAGSKGPYIQSERLTLYGEAAEKLLVSGHAYRCFCTPERLEEMRKLQTERKQAPMYDRRCLSLTEDERKKIEAAGTPSVIRLKIPQTEVIAFTDEIRGKISFSGHTVDDQVLIKSDGFPTYHLAHVVDDHHMEIDLVIRGEEWLSSLPKHLLLFRALGWDPPKFAHVPLLLNADRTKLSKRQGSVAVEEYIAKGYLPETLLNFLALLGWNPGTTQELFSLEELIATFDLSRVQKAGAIFDLEKLNWLQGQWIRKIPPEDFAKRIQPIVAERVPNAAKDDHFLEKAALVQERITFFTEAPEILGFFYETPNVSIELLANEKQKVTREIVGPILEALTKALDGVSEKTWALETVKSALIPVAEGGTWKRGQVLWVLRCALTGQAFSPGAYEVAALLGKEETLARLKGVLE